jgi:hypothetical protein
MQQFRQFFGGCRAINITTPMIRKYIERRQEEGAANATIDRYDIVSESDLREAAKRVSSTPPALRVDPPGTPIMNNVASQGKASLSDPRRS